MTGTGPTAVPAPHPGIAGLLRAAAGDFRWRLAGVIALGVEAAVVEGVGIALLVPLLRLAGVYAGPGRGGPVTQAAESVLRRFCLDRSLLGVLAIFVAVATAQAALSRAASDGAAEVPADFAASLRKRLYAAVARTRWAFFSGTRASEIAHALTAEADRAGQARWFAVALATEGAVAAVYVALALALSPAATGVAVGAGAALLLLLRPGSRAARERGTEVSDATAAYWAALEAHLQGARLARVFGNEARSEAAFRDLADRVAEGERALPRLFGATRMWFEIGAAFAVAGIVLLGRDAAGLSPAALLAFLFLATRLLRRASSLMNHAQMLAGMLPSWGRVAALLAACEAEAEGPAATPASAGGAADLRREIRLEGVTFRYRPDAAPAVDGLDLAIPAGATVALVGPSGAGKSTAADLVTGLLRPSAGRILVDGEPLGPERLGPWRSRLGYVSQDPFLFHDSVRANLLWAKPDATEADLEEALRAADALEVVRRRPRGLDTPVGDRGATLSGGERQRIALARALVRRPALLVLDEATSHLDAESEERIRGAIEALRGRMTILVVAHRLGTVRRADRIHVMEGGRVVESDGWDGLLARPGGRFRALAAAQGLVAAR